MSSPKVSAIRHGTARCSMVGSMTKDSSTFDVRGRLQLALAYHILGADGICFMCVCSLRQPLSFQLRFVGNHNQRISEAQTDVIGNTGNFKLWGQVDEGSVFFVGGGLHAMSGDSSRTLREIISVYGTRSELQPLLSRGRLYQPHSGGCIAH